MLHEEFQKIAELLFPDVTLSPADVLAASQPRELPEGAAVTRYAPSPTGFLHIGGVYAALISERMAHQSRGVFMLRIEDTDKQREIEDGVRIIAGGLAQFGIHIDEGVKPDMTQVGEYGPYIQSQRLPLYRAFLKDLVARGFAYPCFCSSAELDEIRQTQELQKIKTGYYGRWAKYRNVTLSEVQDHLGRGEQFAVRLKSQGTDGQKFNFKDLIKGGLTLSANDNDAILLKSDGFPTYHWAHCVDDKLMRTTHVIRGDEWLPSAPLHVELFNLMGWEHPRYAHIAPIVKIDETGSKRKLSKRKDPEANVEFYFSEGYPIEAVTEYLLNLVNSNFEDWRRENPDKPNTDFVVRLEKANVSGALFDFVKLADISKTMISRMSADEVYTRVFAWAQQHDAEFAMWLESNREYAMKIFNIEREGDKRRKDIAKWSDVKDTIAYFMNDDVVFARPEKLDATTTRAVLEKTVAVINLSDTSDEWLAKLRGIAAELGFAQDTKSFKAAPETFKGHVGDVAMVLRLALTGRTNTPDLHQMMQALGEQRVRARLEKALATI